MNVSEIGVIRLRSLLGEEENLSLGQSKLVKKDVCRLLEQYFFLKKGDVNVNVKREEGGYEIIIDAKAYDIKGGQYLPK